MSVAREANPERTCFEVVILEPPLAGQLETTVEQSGVWRAKDDYLLERQAAFADAIARILGHGSFVGRTIADAAGLEATARDVAGGARMYFLPHMTLCDPSTVARLGIRHDNFYGGCVAHPHERTKLLMHELPHPGAARPDGWNPEFARAVSRLAAPGSSVFGMDDLRDAARGVLERFGRARIKLATGADGLGQFVIDRQDRLDDVLEEVVAANVIDNGACVEVDLSDPITYSVNTDTIGALRISSVGIHRRDMTNPMAQTEIGTDYHMVAGDVDDIRLDWTGLNEEHVRRIVRIVREFDREVSLHLPHILVTRNTYQAIVGRDPHGRLRMGILEQSWRRGGSSANTLLAAREFQRDSSVAQVSCSQDNRFGGAVGPDDWVLSTCRDLPYVSRVTGRHYS